MYKKSFAAGIFLVLLGIALIVGPRVGPPSREPLQTPQRAEAIARESAPPLWASFAGGLSMAAGFGFIAFGIGRWERWSKGEGDPRV